MNLNPYDLDSLGVFLTPVPIAGLCISRPSRFVLGQTQAAAALSPVAVAGACWHTFRS